MTVSNEPTREAVQKFEDSREKVRTCPKCGRPCYLGDVDPCLGYLPGVIFACCGHGGKNSYIVFENGVTIRGFNFVAFDGPLTDFQRNMYVNVRKFYEATPNARDPFLQPERHAPIPRDKKRKVKK